jgi:hypothetical protein
VKSLRHLSHLTQVAPNAAAASAFSAYTATAAAEHDRCAPRCPAIIGPSQTLHLGARRTER